MKHSILLIKALLIIFFLSTSCKKDSNSGPTDYSGVWGRTTSAWNGNTHSDTVTILHSNDSIFITDGYLIDEAGIIKSDTISIYKSNTVGLQYLVIESDTKFQSNYPINRTINTIEYKKIN